MSADGEARERSSAEAERRLARLLRPRDPGFDAEARRVFAERADLAAAYADFESSGYAKWLGVNGLREYPERLGRFYPPIPPAELRHTGCGGPTEHSHLYTAVEDFQVLLELWEIYAERRPEDIGSVLDFGCACGRVMRWFSLALPEAECLGADVRAASIDWCNANLRGRYLANGVRPPLDLPDDSVELVVSLSIFSHLNRASNLAWFRELVRVTKPGGLLLLSTHGAFAMAVVMRSPEKQQIFCTTRDEALAGLRALSREHFVFRPLPLETVRGLDGPEDAYGQTFFTEAFVRAEWEPLAEVVGYVPVSLNLLQDFFVLRKRG